jgi:hypothetical protein
MVTPPLQLELQSSVHILAVNIQQFSLEFTPKPQTLLPLLNRKTNPFAMSPSELEQTIAVRFLNRVHNVTLKSLFGNKCNKISGSESLECDIYSSQEGTDDLGMLLFEFEPVVCGGRMGVELGRERHGDGQSYYWSHLAMIGANVGVLLLFKHRFAAVRKVGGVFGWRRVERNH